MANLVFYLIVQTNLIFGVAGLMWPDKLMPVFGLLMFPWPASHRAIRTHGFVAIGGYFFVRGKILVTIRYPWSANSAKLFLSQQLITNTTQQKSLTVSTLEAQPPLPS